MWELTICVVSIERSPNPKLCVFGGGGGGGGRVRKENIGGGE